MRALEDVQIAILMGGLGTRLRAETGELPKAMANVHGRPFFEYQLELFKSYKFSSFVFCIGYGAAAIRDHFGDGRKFGVKIRYSEEGQKLLGTAGALKKALPLLGEDFMVCYGDSYMSIDYEEFWRRFERTRQAGPCALMSVLHNRGRLEKSNASFKDGLVRYDKKNPSADMEYADYGVGAMASSFLSGLPDGKSYDLADLYHDISEERKLFGYEAEERFYEIGTPASLAEFRELVKSNLTEKRPAVFLDRDGTLNEAHGEGSPFLEKDAHLLPAAAESLRKLRAMGFRLVMVTNQPAAAKGQVSLEALRRVNARLVADLRRDGVEFDAVQVCYHHPQGAPGGDASLVRECECRKPKDGMLRRALGKFAIDLSSSYMVGDSAKDVQAGRSIGVRTVAVGAEAAAEGADLSFAGIKDFVDYLQGAEK